MNMAREKIVVIGAGIGGLAAAIRLAAAGMDITLCEAHATPGGKLRALPSAAGPVDAGPTVLTLRGVFDDLFAAAGTTLEQHLALRPLTCLARHWWQDGPQLDLFADPQASADAIGQAFGARASAEFRRFDARMARLYAAFEGPMMLAQQPQLSRATATALRDPALWPLLLPGRSLAGLLRAQFTDPRLRQLFGRYSTYVGGIPARVPAVLGLIWRAEAAGVWTIPGGLHRLAGVLAGVFEGLGGTLRLNTPVQRIEVQSGRVAAVILPGGARIGCAQVVFNGDPGALSAGLLGAPAQAALPASAHAPRSLSARVWTFAARASGPPLQHHNLFFARAEGEEFTSLAQGRAPDQPTIYICADGQGLADPGGLTRFQFILNAPPLRPGAETTSDHEAQSCLTNTFARLDRFGLRFDPQPGVENLTLPGHFAALFPGSGGAIYGRSPHGTMAPFLRPTARTRLPGLYLAGGGAHPGAGLPMAALSGRNAAAAVLEDRISAPRSRPMAMPGGIWTRSAIAGRARFR